MKLHTTTRQERLALLARHKATGDFQPHDTKAQHENNPEPKPSPEVREKARLACRKLYEYWRND